SCNAVVILELNNELIIDVRQFYKLKRNLQRGTKISFTGEETKQGEILAPKGTYINPGMVALLATFGYKNVPAGSKPKVGIIATGSELLEVDEPLQPGKIRNSNSYMVRSQVERAGGVPVYFGQFSDDFGSCYQHVKDA